MHFPSFGRASFSHMRSKKVNFRHRFEVPKSIDFGVQKGIHFGQFLSKIPMFFIGFVYLNWGPFWGPFLGTLISQPGSIHCIRVCKPSSFGTPHQKLRAPKNGPKNGPQFRYKNLLKTLVFLIKIDQNGPLFGSQNRSI